MPPAPRHPLSINSTAAVCVSCLSAIKANADDEREPRPHNVQLPDRVADNYHDNMIRETKRDRTAEISKRLPVSLGMDAISAFDT